MVFSSRQGIVFGVGLLLGVMAGGVALLAWKDAGVQAKAQGQAPAAQQALASAGDACTFGPLLPALHADDGQFNPPAELGDKTLTDILAYMGVGGDAATKGRVRDAEVALITACRIAAQVAGTASPELGDAKYELARHYTAVAAASPAADPHRSEVLKRAESLFAQSMELYAAKYGRPHEKARLAAAGVTLARHASLMTAHLQQAAAAAAAGAHEVGANDPFAAAVTTGAGAAAPSAEEAQRQAAAEAEKPAEKAAAAKPPDTARVAEAAKPSETTRSAEAAKKPEPLERAEPPSRQETTRSAQAPVRPAESTRASTPDTATMGAAPAPSRPRPAPPRSEVQPPPAAAAPSSGSAEAPLRGDTPPAPPASIPDEY